MSGSDVCSSGKSWLQHTRYPLCDCGSTLTPTTAVTTAPPHYAPIAPAVTYDTEHPHATAAAERYIKVDGPGDVTGLFTVELEVEPDAYLILSREKTMRHANQTADIYRQALAHVLTDYAIARATTAKETA